MKFILLKSLKHHGTNINDENESNDDFVEDDDDDDLYQEDNDVLKVYVYAINQKARSEAVFVREFQIGNSKKNGNLTLHYHKSLNH